MMHTARQLSSTTGEARPQPPHARVAVWGWAAACLLYLCSVGPHWYPTPDSALYRMLGQNLAAGEGYTLWGQPHVHVPPGFPLLLAGFELCGLQNDVWLNLGMVVLTLLTLRMVYLTLRQQTSRQLATTVTLVIALSAAMHLASIRQLSEAPYMVLLWASCALLLRGLRTGGSCLELGSLMMVATVWFRIAGLPLAAAASLGLLWEPGRISVWRQRANALLIACGVTVSAGLFFAAHRAATAAQPLPSYGNSVARMMERSPWTWITSPAIHCWQTNGALAKLFFADELSSLGLLIGLLWAPLVLGIVLAVRQRQILAAAIVVGYLGGILLHRPLLTRYLLPVAPWLVLFSFYGHRFLVQRWSSHARWGRAAIAAIAALLILANLPRSMRTAYHVHRPDRAKQAAEWQSTREAADQLKLLANQDDRFMSSSSPRVLAFLSQVPSLPLGRSRIHGGPYTLQDFRGWLAEGVTLAVVDRDHSCKYHGRLFSDAVLTAEGFQSVFSNRHFHIYRRATRPEGELSVACTEARK